MSNKSPLKAYREAMKMSQAELAELVGVQDAAVCKWEKGEVSWKQVLRVEEVTGIPRYILRPDIYPAPKKSREGAAA